MANYLDPKHDLVFKKIFGERPHLLISFLNAILPLDTVIETVEYLSPEMAPETPTRKNSIVDVLCVDNLKRTFIVEMQLYWSNVFMSRMVFNTSKAYVRQLGKADTFTLLQPVYGVGIINDVYDKVTDEFYHHYQIVNRENTDEVIEGLEYIMVELPKFKISKWEEKQMAVLWLRFLSEIDENTKKVPAELLNDATINEALSICEEVAYTDSERIRYDEFWDIIRTEKGLIETSLHEGLTKGIKEGRVEGRKEGMKEGLSKGLAKGREEGMEETNRKIIAGCKKSGLSIEQIIDITGLSEEQINKLSNS